MALTWGVQCHNGMPSLMVGHQSSVLLLDNCTLPLWTHNELVTSKVQVCGGDSIVAVS